MVFQKHNWIGKPAVETLCILLLPFFCCLLIFFLPNSIIDTDILPDFAWLILVVFIDVGHVYSTFYRTYTDKSLVLKYKNLFFGLPLLLLMASILLHSVNGMLFWRCLAYMAVFHFIRQQYGFLRIYSRKNNYPAYKLRFDAFTIYSITLLPVLFWHFAGDRNFNWFLKGDFFQFGASTLLPTLIIVLFWTIIALYILSEALFFIRTREINLQKNAIISGTALSWYIGIVLFNSDIVFTLLNIICHGIPYMALVWIHGKKANSGSGSATFLKIIYGRFSFLLFLLPLLVMALLEEGLWDTFVWKEHSGLFNWLHFREFLVPKSVLNILVPLLALPQLFHYVIDGHIWKLKKDKFEWTKIL